MWRWIFIGFVVIAIALAAMSGLAPRKQPPTAVYTAPVGRQTITRIVGGAGKVQPARKINVSANITGTLNELNVVTGQEVKKGELLAQIDTSRYVSIVAQQRAVLAAAWADASSVRTRLERLQRDRARIETLAKQGGVGSADLDAAQAAEREAVAALNAANNRARQAQAGLDEAANSLQWATLRAPVDGVVLSVNHRVGERIRGSDFSEDVVLVIGTVAQMEVIIEVSEQDIVYVKPKQVPPQKAIVTLDAFPDSEFVGEVYNSGRDAIVKFAGTDNEVTTYQVWIALPQAPPTALSGMSAHVDIETDTRDRALAVPLAAVTVRSTDEIAAARGSQDAGKAAPAKPADARAKLEKVVFVLADNKVELRPVTLGLASDTMVEVLSGLKEGDVIVEGPYRVLARQLTHGANVIAQPREQWMQAQ